jgi:DNA-directed RNA polymerase subunit RPC12/RpoP
MYYAAFEWSINCPKCDSPVMLNGPLQTALCDKCQSDISIPTDYWKDLLPDIMEEVKNELKEGEGSNSNIFGTFKTTLLYGKLQPRCEKCKTPIPMKEKVTESSKYTCTECKSIIPLSPSPPWFKKILPAIQLLVNAELETGTKSEESTVSGPIVFSCIKCGGALTVDGSDRLVPCQYCGVNVYLPDDLWFRLHPMKKKQRWYIGFNKESA